jgi:endonuclease G
MADFEDLDQRINEELLDVLGGNNPRIDIDPFRNLIDDISPAQIIDNDGYFDEIEVNEDQLVDAQGLEQIVHAFKRPSLLIQQGLFDPSPSPTWNDVLGKALPKLKTVIPSVGRIEVKNHDNKEWVGTGFLIEPDLIVTNRHIAREFLVMKAPYSFRTNMDGKSLKAWIDFREEHKQPDEEELDITEAVYVADEEDFDIAILKCPAAADKVAPLKLSSTVNPSALVATVGYPWKDSRGLASIHEVITRIFKDIFGVKRISPGKLLESENESLIFHDCTTTGGSSGSPLFDISNGEVVGLHFKGGRKFNSAVSASTLRKIISSSGLN